MKIGKFICRSRPWLEVKDNELISAVAVSISAGFEPDTPLSLRTPVNPQSIPQR